MISDVAVLPDSVVVNFVQPCHILVFVGVYRQPPGPPHFILKVFVWGYTLCKCQLVIYSTYP